MTRGRHILITTDAVGGVWTHAHDLAAGLVARGDGVTLAVLGPALTKDQRAEARLDGIDVVETGLPLEWQASSDSELDRAGAALAVLARGADLVHLNSPMLAPAMAGGAPIVAGCHSCLASWWETVRGGPLPPDFRARTLRLAHGYRACAALVAPSRTFAATTRRIYGVAPHVVANGRSRAAAAPVGARRAEAVFAGRLWDAGKRVALLDKVAARMRHPIAVAGPLAAPGGGAARFPNLNLLGTLPAAALAHRLAGASVFVSLAVYEPFGLAVLEAAQAGCALVLADIPVFRELWEDAALFVDGDDPARIGRTLESLLDDPRRCARLGRAALARSERFSRDAMVTAMTAVYERVLAPRLAEAAA